MYVAGGVCKLRSLIDLLGHFSAFSRGRASASASCST